MRQATSSTDKTLAALRTIHCLGATGDGGYKGRTVVYIAMHAWHGQRGLYLAHRIRDMYDAGCYVRILYSFMGHGTYSLLTRHTNSRMIARRVLFAGPGGEVAAKYSHMKFFAASGRVGDDTDAHVTWTGSNNWADRSIKADEVTIRIPSKSVYNAYVDHWNFMRARRSSATWAIYEEPGGGGRVPD
jgi:phosphatidylserine/phosphatidylglycerophosphate/cardiolipin synthase-like enzyme